MIGVKPPPLAPAPVRPLDGGDAAIARAAALIAEGRLVSFPTETVYGLGGDATSDRAVAAIFAAKGRPQFNPLIIHVLDIDRAAALVVMDRRSRLLAERFWSGPLTLVLPRRAGCGISLLCSAGLESLAIRVPRHEIARALLAATGKPLAAPSANRSGRLSPTTAAHVSAELGDRVDLVLDGGACDVGVESTVIDLTGDAAVLLRPGGIAAEAIEAVIGPLVRPETMVGDAPRLSPGMLASHYAPALPLRLGVTAPEDGEAFLGFGPVPDGIRHPDLQLSATGDLTEAAANLFAHLRRLDQAPYRGIAVMPIPDRGLGLAINDRLRRAAAPRP